MRYEAGFQLERECTLNQSKAVSGKDVTVYRRLWSDLAVCVLALRNCGSRVRAEIALS